MDTKKTAAMTKKDKEGTGFSLFTEYLVKDLDGFFEEIEENAKNYDYVAFAEDRCFNLAWHYLTDKSRICTFNGLLLQSKAIAEAYRNSDPMRFPSILLVDDALLHGRSIAKIISHLEELLFDELQPSKMEELFEMSRELARAIDISVYAMNRFPTLLNDRYLEKIICREKLYTNDMRDLTLQLSNHLSHCDVAKTSFTPSVRYRQLYDSMLKKAKSADNGTGWQFLQWEYDGEKMILACRPSGSGNVNRISTIRIFPDRKNGNQPWITSCTLLGNIESTVFDNLCKKAADILDIDGAEPLRDILLSQETILQHNRGQLLCYLISAVDLMTFMEAMGQTDITKATKGNDSDKIASNFGNIELRDALNLVFESNKIRECLKTELIPAIEQAACPILNVAPEDCVYQKPNSTKAKEKDIRVFNDILQDIFYKIAILSEESAYEKREKPYQFSPETYQDYQEYRMSVSKRETADENYGCHGVVPLDVFGQLTIEEIHKRDIDVPSHVFQLIAVYTMLCDAGIARNTIQASRKHRGFMMLATADDLATHYFPRQMVAFIPAMRLLEDRYYRIGLTRMGAIMSFYGETLSRMTEYGKKLVQETIFDDIEKKKWNEMTKALPDLKTMEQYTEMLYAAGHSFGGYEFENLGRPDFDFVEKCQRCIWTAVCEFLCLSDESL